MRLLANEQKLMTSYAKKLTGRSVTIVMGTYQGERFIKEQLELVGCTNPLQLATLCQR